MAGIQTLADLRAWAGPEWQDASDEDVMAMYSRAAKVNPAQVANVLGYDMGKGSLTGERVSGAVDSYQSNLYDVAGRVTSGLGLNRATDWLDERRRGNKFQADVAQGRAHALGGIDSFKDVHGPGDFFGNYLPGLGIQSAPYLAEAIGGGLLGGATLPATAARMGYGLSRAAGATAGAVGASYPSAVGDILSNQREEAGEVNAPAAFGLGVPYAALNAFGLEGAAARGSLFRNGVRALDNIPGVRGGLARAGATAAGVGLQEGASEVGQEFLNQAGRNAVNPNAGYFGPEAMNRYGESFVGGAALGGVFGGAGGGWRRSQSYQPISQDPGVATDLLNPNPAPQVGWNGFHEVNQGQNPFVVFPDGSTATQADAELMHRYNMTPDDLAGMRAGGPRVDPAMDTGDVSPYLPGKMVADEAGAVALDAPGAESLYGQTGGDPGLALARERFMEQQRQNQQRQQTQQAVQAKAQERQGLIQRTKEATGVDGTRAVDLFADLERQRDAGQLSESDFVGEAALISTREFGKVAKNIKARDPAAQEQANGAGGSGRPGAADLGRGPGNQSAPGQPGNVQPATPGAAAQAVVRPGAAELRPGVPGGADALTRVTPETATAFHRAFKALTPERKGLVQRWLGVDENLDIVDDPETLDSIAATMVDPKTRKTGITRQAAHKQLKSILAAYGMPADMTPEQIRSRFLAPDLADTTRHTDTPTRSSDDVEAVNQEVSEALEEGAEQDNSAAASAAEAGLTDEQLTSTETVGERVEAQRKPRKTVQDYLQRAMREGNVSQADIDEAADSFNEDLPEGAPTWADLTPEEQAAWVGAHVKHYSGYATARDYNRAWNEVQDAASKRRERQATNDARSPGRAQRTAQAGAAPARVQEAADRAAPEASTDEDVSWGDDAAQMSRNRNRGGALMHTAETLEDSLTAFMNVDALGKRVVIIESTADLKDINDLLAHADEDAVAWARDGRAYLVADRIPVGKERGVFLHEVGGHLGLERMLGQKEFDRLTGQIISWSTRTDNSTEARIAKKARERVDQADITDPNQRMPELVAYFLEEAVNAGVNPSAMKHDTPLNRWMRSVWAAFKIALRKLGVNPDKLTSQDVVDLAYGAARVTVAGRYHGTAAKVQQFRTKYIGTGEGAQAFGWGMYFSELKGVAGHYRRADEKQKGSRGRVYAADIAIKPDEFLEWTKTLDEQPARVQELLDTNPALQRYAEEAESAGYDNGTGGSLYHYLADVASEGGLEFAPGALTPEQNADYEGGDMPYTQVASRWLDSIGIKGVRMPVDYQSTGRDGGNSNFVVFNEKNVVKTLVNPENRVSKSVQFSKMAKPADATALDAAQAAITKNLPAPAKDGWTNVRDFFMKHAPYLMTNFQMAEQWGAKIKSLKSYVHVADLMRMETVRQQMQFDDVAKRWNALPKAALQALNEVTQRATMAKTHPDLALDDKANAHLTEAQRAAYPELAAKYKQMASTYPEAAKVYQDALRTLTESRTRMEEAAAQLYENYGIARTVPKAMPGPYFPLMRFGEYLAIGESAQYKDLADQVAQATDGSTRKALQKKLDELEQDPTHYAVSAHETRSAMERAAAQYKAQGLEERTNMTAQRLDALPKDVHKMVSQLAAEMAGKFDGDTATAVIDSYKEMLIKALPELHALNRAAQRKSVEGASADMLRAFATAGRQNAFYTARLLHAKDSASAMQDMKAETKGDTDLTHVHREMEKRAALDLQFKDTPIQDMLGSAAWVYYLGASPTFLFMNATQPWLVTGPVLAGRYGAFKATQALGTASREALATLKAARWKDGKWDWWAGINEESVKTTRRNAEGVSEDRKALRELMQRGIVDEGLQHEVRTFADGGNGKLAALGRGVGWASQQIELTNRVATALATFRLARETMSYEKAVEEAYRVTTNTQMDYSAEGTPRFMREGGGIPGAKLIFQFRRYQQAMLYVMYDNVKKLSNPAERKVAAKSLAYFALVNGLAAGALGLPFVGTFLAVASAFMDDDDEEGDAKTRLRNLLFDLTGDRGMADVMAKGIPAMFGADLSSRIGLGDIAQLYPRLELNGKTGEENVGKLVAAIAGPSAGLATQFFQSGIHFANGDWAKGTEKMLPKMFADPARAARFQLQGMTDGKGEEILGPDEIGAWDKFMRAVGTTPLVEANYYEANKARHDVQQAATDRKTRIHTEFRRALRSGDYETFREMVDEFNAEHPQSAIKPKDEAAWRKEARKAQGQRDDTGIKFNPKRDQNYGELQRFARG